MSSRPVRTPLEQSVIAVGPVLAVGSAWLLSLPSDHDAAGVTQANVALAIAIITVGVAILDWVAGVATSIAAALALNYFHTLPSHTVRITDRRDVYSVVLLAALGLGVSAITAWRVRRRVVAIRQDDARNAGRELELLIGEERPATEVWSAAITAAANDLGLITAKLVQRTPGEVPVVSRRLIEGDPTLLLPVGGAAITLRHRHSGGRYLMLTPRAGLGPVALDRRAVLSFAGAVELALAPEPVPSA